MNARRALAPSPSPSPAPVPVTVDSSFLRTLVGYNTRRATLRIFEVFTHRMEELALKPVEFSILCLIGRNSGVTPSQLGAELGLLPPNLTKLLSRLEQRDLVVRQVQAADRRAVSLSLSPAGQTLLAQAEARVTALEVDATAALTPLQRETLITLLQKIYR